MAAPPCMSEDGRPAVFVGTILDGGRAFALCDECFRSWAIAIVHETTGIDPAPFIAAISEDIATTAEGAPSDEPSAPGPADDDNPEGVVPEAGSALEVPGEDSVGRPRPSRTRAAGRGQKTSPDRGTENGQPEREPEVTSVEDSPAAV